LANAKAALDSAAAAGALRYSEPTYRLAEETLQQGWMEMARQKGRFGPFRDFRFADSLLAQAIEFANQSASVARGEEQKLRDKAQAEQNALKNELQEWHEAINGSLMSREAQRFWSSAELGYQMCDNLVQNAEYEEALTAVRRSRSYLNQLSQLLAEYSNNEAHLKSQWRRWVQETLADSRSKGNHAVIVDKSVHKAYMVHEGKLVRSYSCEIGYNSANQKLFAGDGATPEGKYRIADVRRNGSKYYKALLLDYPNDADQKRFRTNKSKGLITRHARIGKNIEIHGGGGKNRDWTDGCVALMNEDMDSIMKYVEVGTLVTIVRRSDQWPEITSRHH